MSSTNVSPDGTFTRLERVLRRERRLMFSNVAAMSALVGMVILVLASAM